MGPSPPPPPDPTRQSWQWFSARALKPQTTRHFGRGTRARTLSSQSTHFGRQGWPTPPKAELACGRQVSERDTPTQSRAAGPAAARTTHNAERAHKKARQHAHTLRTRQLSTAPATASRAPRSGPREFKHTHTHTARTHTHAHARVECEGVVKGVSPSGEGLRPKASKA